MLSADQLGVDDRAIELLSTLPDDKQQVILQALAEGLEQGKIRNASAFVAARARGPEALGIDERACELLRQLPKATQSEVLTKLRQTEGVKNPSAWIVNHIHKAMPSAVVPAPSFGFAQ